jgi:hypothetical protein
MGGVNMTITQSRRVWAACLLLAGVVGCGGGDDDGDDDDPSSTLNDSNSDDAARGAYTTGDSLAGTGSSQTDSYVSAATVDGQAVSGVEATHRALQFVQQQQSESGDSIDTVTGVEKEGVYQCQSGEFEVISSSDQNPDILETGDEFEIVFRDCAVSSLVINGSFEFDVNNTNNNDQIGTTDNGPWQYTVALRYDQWRISGRVDLLFDGSLKLTYKYRDKSADSDDFYVTLLETGSSSTLTFESGSISNTFSDVDIRYTEGETTDNYTLNADYKSDYSNDSLDDSSVTVTTDDNDVLTDDGSSTDNNRFPDTGKITVEDDEGNKAVLDASQCAQDEYQLTFTSSGGGTTTECKSWQ